MKLRIFYRKNSFGIFLCKDNYKFGSIESLRLVDYNSVFYKDMYCFAIVYLEDENVLLNWISTNPEYFNLGLATRLIHEIYDIGKKMGKKYILLDDCSGVLPPKNIYYKMGFQVKSCNGVWVDWETEYEVDEERRKDII